MTHRPRSGPTWRRVGLLILPLAAIALVSAPVGRQLLIAFDIERARRSLNAVELKEALEWLQAAERRQPDRADVQYLLGVAYRRDGDYVHAEEHLRRALALGWPMPELEQQRMMIEFQMGEIAQAEPYLIQLLERGGSDDLAEDVYEAMTIGYLAERRSKEANFFLHSWIEWRPDSLRARLLGAYFYFYGDLPPNPSVMEAELREVLRIAPGRTTERLVLAEVLTHQKRVGEAMAECEICQRQAPANGRVKLLFGACHFQMGRLDEARRELELGLEAPLDPRSRLRGLMVLGQVASALRDFELAKRCCEQALELRPYDGTAAYGLGMALSKLGRHELAKQYVQRSQRLLEQEKQLAEISQELTMNAENVELRLRAARILIDQERLADAAGWMQSVLRYDPNCGEAHEYLGDFFEAHGKSPQIQ